MNIQNDEQHRLDGSLRWRVVIVCCLAQNLAMAMAFGTFGPMLASTEARFGVSRGVAASGMGFMMLSLGVLSPVLGSLLQRLSVRSAMLAGALVSSVGYGGLALVDSFKWALLMYGLIGTGVSLLGILGPLVLINRWFMTNRAKTLSLVNLPIALFLTPYLIAWVLPVYGRFDALCVIGAAFLLIVPLLLLLVEYPATLANRANKAAEADVTDLTTSEGIGSILRTPAFWLVSLGIGVIAGAGTAFVVHIVPFGTDRALSLHAAAGLLSVYSGSGIFGTLFLGWLADRIGPPTTLVIAAAIMSGLWWSIFYIGGGLLYVVAALIGVFGVPVVTLHGAALSEIFSVRTISRAMGCSYAVKLPFIFSFAPAVGMLFDRSGNYRTPFLIIAGLLAIAAICFYIVRLLAGWQTQSITHPRPSIASM